MKIRFIAVISILLFLNPAFLFAKKHTVFVEAESFQNVGGWVIDQQSMDVMGSSYLLAHGLGKACDDAVTTVQFNRKGNYHVWVRTRNWAPAQKKEESPGRFQVKINGHALDTVFGQDKTEWSWHYGGEVKITNNQNEIRLHDLTGFEGRCDGLFFSTNKNLIENGSEDAMLELRKQVLGFPEKPTNLGNFDLVVVGGGVAGMAASVSAARLGLNVALVQNRPVLGGNNSSEIRVHMSGDLDIEPFPALGKVVKEINTTNPEWYAGDYQAYSSLNDEQKLAILAAEPNLTLLMELHVSDAMVSDGTIKNAIAKNIRTGEEFAIEGQLFADCTGDGNLGVAAGADSRYGRESKGETGEKIAPEKADSLVIGSTIHWLTKDTGVPAKFPVTPWAHQFSEESCQKAYQGAWNWETGFQYDMVKEVEFIRDNMFRAVYGNWSFQKNSYSDKEKFADYEIYWMGYVLGKRESRRLLGDVIFSANDLEREEWYPDACVSTKWGIDIHYPHPENTKYFPGLEFRSASYHPLKLTHPIRPMPYRSFYSRNINNLFMAGRCASMTHLAHGMFRVMNTTGMMGEVVGIAASLCKKYKCQPRDLYTKHLDELLAAFEKGVPIK